MDYIPDDNLSAILSRTSPRDACRSSAVSTRFRTTADWDSVWERFLPADYSEIIARSASPLAFDSKKQLYFLLADSHIILDGRSMSFSLDKESGKKCYMLGARELAITWGDTPCYWKWITLSQSRFAEVAHLLSVWWLEIIGRIDTSLLTPNTTYVAYLVYEVAQGGRGFDSVPMTASISFTGEGREEVEPETSVVYLRTCRKGRNIPAVGRLPRKRKDEWMEIELGEFYNYGDGGEVEMALRETAGIWKKGLTVEGIEVRPKVDE